MQNLFHSFIVSKRRALCHEKTGKADLGVYQEICCLNKTQRFKHSCLQSQQSSPLQDPFPTPLLRTRLQPPPISLITTTPPPPATTPPPPPNRSEAAEAFYEAQLVLVSARAEQTLCASGSAYLQPRCVLLVADLQRLPLVLLLLQLAIAVRQLFHQTCVLGTQLVQLC